MTKFMWPARIATITGVAISMLGMEGTGVALAGSAMPGTTTRVSVPLTGVQNESNGSQASMPSLSAQGRYVAFSSTMSNLVANDTNATTDDRPATFCGGAPSASLDPHNTDKPVRLSQRGQDIFVRDTFTGTTERVSVASDGAQADSSSYRPKITPDGRYVVFDSDADNLERGDTSCGPDVFVHDRVTGKTERVSVASDGTQAMGRSIGASITPDGRYVAFESGAANLVADDTNAPEMYACAAAWSAPNAVAPVSPCGVADSWDGRDIFVHDRVTGTTKRVSVASDGTQADGISAWPSITPDGRFVAFWSSADNLVPGDTNGTNDVFVHDLQTGRTERISVASDGSQGNDTSTVGSRMSISADGRFVEFNSSADNLVPGDTNDDNDEFVRDRQTGTTERISITSTGKQAHGFSLAGVMSSDGRYIAFLSDATDLVPDDAGPGSQVYLRDRKLGATEVVSVTNDGSKADASMRNFSGGALGISPDGLSIGFATEASNLVPGDDTEGSTNVFVRHSAPAAP